MAATMRYIMPLRGSGRLSDIIEEVDAGEIPYANTP